MRVTSDDLRILRICRSTGYKTIRATHVTIGGSELVKSTVPEARLAFNGDRTSRFFLRDALGHVFVVGFIK